MKFYVENMARIDNASIDIKPLTVFVGKNGTNKSYMAHLVYEAYKEINSLEESGLFHESKLSQSIIRGYSQNNKISSDEIISTITDKKKKYERYQIGEDEFESIELDEYSFDIEKLDDISLLEDINKYVMNEILKKINASYNSKFDVIGKLFFEYKTKEIFTTKVINIQVTEGANYLTPLFRVLIRKIFQFLSDQLDAKEFFYFPSSRTGFVLAFDEIVSGVFRDRFGGKPTGTKLTIPTIDFLSNFVDIKTGKFEEKFDLYDYGISHRTKHKKIPKNILTYLEKEILKGEIIEDKNEEDYTQYSLKTNNNKILDLHLTSTATLELLPIIVFLKHFDTIDDKLLVIEEPEAHLHPNAQKIMARFLILLIKKGAKVLITTHSDIILKEISDNLYSGLQDKDLKLNESDIGIYHFKDLDTSVQVSSYDIDCNQAMPIADLTEIENEIN